MKISLDDARRVSELASLELDAGELEQMAAEMSRILDYVDQLEAVDLSAVPDEDERETRPAREDEARPSSLDHEISYNAPSMLHGHFVVPKVIGGD